MKAIILKSLSSSISILLRHTVISHPVRRLSCQSMLRKDCLQAEPAVDEESPIIINKVYTSGVKSSPHKDSGAPDHQGAKRPKYHFEGENARSDHEESCNGAVELLRVRQQVLKEITTGLEEILGGGDEGLGETHCCKWLCG